ncbi:MAG: HAMP domain-containing sensor histidine kinase [Clostridia bacterium]
MKRRLTLAMIAVFVPMLLLLAYGMSERSFALCMEREQQRTQMTEGLIAAEVRGALTGLDYSGIVEVARQYRTAYAAQGVELMLLYGDKPLSGAELTSYTAMLSGQRCAMLDTRSIPQRYVIAEPMTEHVTLLLLHNVSDLYQLRADLRRTYLQYALAGAALVAALAYLLAWSFARPITRLTQAARLLAQQSSAAVALPVHRHDELGTLAQSFAEMQSTVYARETALLEETQSRQTLLDALAHELRTPLCALLGNARLLQNEAMTALKRHAIVDEMVHEIKRLSNMDTQLMKLTQLSHEPLEKSPVALLALLEETAARLLTQAEGIRLIVTGDNVQLNGDAALLSLLADNLTINALRASHAGQAVTLTAFAGGFCVRDEGDGMTAEQLAHAFQPFYKADKSRTRKAGGVGLGLSLCRRIAELHGATLTLRSAVGAGTLASFNTSL